MKDGKETVSKTLRHDAKNLRIHREILCTGVLYRIPSGRDPPPARSGATVASSRPHAPRPGAGGMKDRDPYHSALNALAGFAAAGRFGWGEPLVATALAEELRLSPTPVREALARLAGEGVIEHRPGRGYFAPSPTASDIADLYELHRRLTHWALDVAPAAASRPAEAPSPPDLRLEILYATTAAAAGADILTRAHRRVMLQLRPIRAVEAAVRPVEVEQIARQERLLEAGRVAELRAEVDAYHDGRRLAAPAVFAVMRRSGQSIERI